MSNSPLTQAEQATADDVLDAAENFLESLASNGDGQSVRAAFYAYYLDMLDAYAKTRAQRWQTN